MTFAVRAASPTTLIRTIAGFALAATVATTPVPAMAQDGVSEARIRKIEAEIRALQRNVFPGADGRFFEPQISSDATGQPTRTNQTSTTAVTDILARLDAIELQLQRLTSLTEENTNALGLMEERVAALEASREGGSPAGPVSEEPATDSNLAAMTGGATETTAQPEAESAPQTETGPSAARLAAVQEIAKPQTDDAADDEYSYGFRLWNAGFYPEARQQLASFIEQYPDHWRITWGRNLLGRAFLDDGLPEEAARWFLRNYQADRTAARAPDSLLFLAESMIAMDDTRRACIALAEFGETYPAVASGRLLDQYEANRRKVTCEG
ncbi:tol-pal system YbgF family protein [Erythrobacter sp. GH1-10]|uniref:tetratricopeptide repeat protein n=1 Tax=Erythrobacter sp. GH1-10 TaxID=3349334 RepID=UPI003877E693